MQLDLFAPAAPTFSRGEALQAVGKLAAAIDAALQTAGLWAYSGSWDAGLVTNREAPSSAGAGADPEAHALQWPATWHICGRSPDALFVEVRPRDGQRESDTVRRTLEIIASVPGSNARLESEVHPAPYYSHGMWTWGQGWLPTEDPEARMAA